LVSVHPPSIPHGVLIAVGNWFILAVMGMEYLFLHLVKNRKKLFISETDGQIPDLTGCKKYTKFVTKKKKTHLQAFGVSVLLPVTQTRVLTRTSPGTGNGEHSTAQP